MTKQRSHELDTIMTQYSNENKQDRYIVS